MGAHTHVAVLGDGQKRAHGEVLTDLDTPGHHPFQAPHVPTIQCLLGPAAGVHDEQRGDHVLAEHVIACEVHAVGQRDAYRVTRQTLGIAREVSAGARATVGVETERLGHPEPSTDLALDVVPLPLSASNSLTLR